MAQAQGRAQGPSGTPKTASARLLTMKFMQRAAASTPSAPSTPRSEVDSSAKRRKVSRAESGTPSDGQLFDQAAIQAAMAEEERKRQAAIEKQAAELGDSRWVLDLRSPTLEDGSSAKSSLDVVQVGFAEIDSPGTAEESNSASQQQIRRFNMKRRKAKKSDNESSGSDEGSSTASSSDEENMGEDRGDRRQQSSGPTATRSPSTLKRKKSGEKVRAKEFADKRRKKEVKLNKLTAISSAGSGGSHSIVCFGCGQAGHRKSDCPAGRR